MIAREGLHIILVGLVLTAGFIVVASRYDSKVLFALSVVFGILTLFSTFFFRDPVRNISVGPGGLVSPADGRVIAVETITDNQIVGDEAIKVSIFLSVFDVHINRVPASGKIDFVRYNPGKFLVAFKDKASHLNEQTEIGMTTETGHKIVFKQIAGLIARRIVCKLKQGDEVSVGDRFGMIRYGSRAELIVPKDTEIKVKVGQHIKGGEGIIGYLPSQPSKSDSESNARGTNIEI
jgi:phosphatidylserine decarboxylase